MSKITWKSFGISFFSKFVNVAYFIVNFKSKIVGVDNQNVFWIGFYGTLDLKIIKLLNSDDFMV